MGNFTTGFGVIWKVACREWRRLVSRPVYIFVMICAPLLSFAFFLTLLDNGLPEELPTAVVDLDHSATSRNLTRQLTVFQTLDITTQYTGFTDARRAMQRGEILGFIVIPESFEADLYANRQPQIPYFTTSVYFIPNALIYKSLTTMTTLAAGAAVQQTLLAQGAYERDIMPQLQPITVDMHALGNPWTSYSIYLNNTFLPGILGLLILLTTIFSIGTETKYGTAREWLDTAHGNILLAVVGKLLPQTVIFFAIGLLCQSLLYGYCGFPLHNGIGTLAVAMLLYIVALQGVSVFLSALLPSLRIALSAGSLLGVVSFSLTGFSFPAEAMYPTFHLLTDILPLRHYFIIYADQALNGIPLYYSRIHFLALLIYPLVSLPFLPLLKRVLKRQIYIP